MLPPPVLVAYISTVVVPHRTNKDGTCETRRGNQEDKFGAAESEIEETKRKKTSPRAYLDVTLPRPQMTANWRVFEITFC